jgi:hypothetical protein
VRAVFPVVALNSRFIGVTAVDSNRLGDSVAADGFLQKPECRLFIAVLREQKVNGLVLLIHRAVQIAPLALDLDIRLVHPLADPHRPLAPMKRLFELWAIFDDPSVHGGVIHLHPPFLHECFDMARAQRVRHIPTDAHENNLWENGHL